MADHDHCDHDPIECSVQAMEGQLDEMTRQRDALLGEVHDLRLALRQTMDELAEAGG